MSAIRWFLAEMLLSWVLDIAPDGKAKDDLAATLAPWLERQVVRIMERRT